MAQSHMLSGEHLFDSQTCLVYFGALRNRFGKLFDEEEIRDTLQASLEPAFSASELIKALRSYQTSTLQRTPHSPQRRVV